MQNRIYPKSIVFVLALLVGCNSDFEQAIEKARPSVVSHISEARPNIFPYFLKKNLSPTWSEKNDIVFLKGKALIDSKGETYSWKQSRPTLYAFFFTSCAGFCPLLVRNLKKIIKDFPDIDVSLISVDPDVDTPSVLRDYKLEHQLPANWKLLSGTKKDIYELLRDDLNVEVRDLSEGDMRKFAHSEYFYLTDRANRVRKIIRGNRQRLVETLDHESMKLL